VLLLAAVAARSRRWWGTVALAVLVLLGALFAFGGLGEVTSDNPNVPKPVLVVAGCAYVLGGLLLSASALAALRESPRRGQQPGRAKA